MDFRTRLNPFAHDDSIDLAVDHYILKYGLFDYFKPQRAMLTMLASPSETVRSFGERLENHEFESDIVDLYIDAGAFSHPQLYPFLARYADRPGLVHRAARAARPLIEGDELLSKVWHRPGDDSHTYAWKAAHGVAAFYERLFDRMKVERGGERLLELWPNPEVEHSRHVPPHKQHL